MHPAVPLVGLDAVALDTETTGLDTARARIVQLGAVRIRKGVVADGERFATLVDPGEPIAAASTAIHGIDDEAVAGAPDFGEAYRRLCGFAGNAMVIGHSVAFDLAVLGAECARAGIAFQPWPVLDTELIAEIAEPALPDTALETLAAWLGVEVVGRHSADGDALTTARVFVAMVPHLRARGIRTRAEAEVACRRLTDARLAAGRPAPAVENGAVGGASLLARIDSFPFRHRNRDVMSVPPVLIGSGETVGAAIGTMAQKKISSLFVADAAGAATGIVTERDTMRAVAADGATALDRPVGEIASPTLLGVAADDYVYRAIGRMTAANIRHLAVTDATGAVVGALSARDLLRVRTSDAVALGDEIDRAEDVGALAAAWARLPGIAGGLLEDGVAAIDIAAIVSREIRAVTRRAALTAEDLQIEDGAGPPPVDYALLVLGSGGRGESLLAADQDNAIVYADTPDAEAADAWFAIFGRRVADILHAAGIPYCKGGVMAANRGWRRSLTEWRDTVATWVSRSNPQDLLNVDIFFDLMPVHGNEALAEELWRHAYELGARGADFAKLLADASGSYEPPVTLFGGFRSENDRVDFKRGGLFPIVASARVLSIRHHVLARATPARLAGLIERKIGGEADLERLIVVHRLLLDHMLRQQVIDMEAGIQPSNRVDVRRLSRVARSELRAAFKDLGPIETLTRDLIFSGRDGSA